MRRVAYAAAVALPLLACQSQASDQQLDRLEGAVRDAMCATTLEDRALALEALADEVERYQPQAEDDDASGAVGVAAAEIEAAGCAPIPAAG